MRRPSLERGLTRRVWLLARRVRWYVRHPLGIVRNAVVFLSIPPFTGAFRAIYTLGLRVDYALPLHLVVVLAVVEAEGESP